MSQMISTGRGGAGNLRRTHKDDLPDSTSELPHLHGKRFTTGRGGKGNMMDNVDPESTRAAQDGNVEMDYDGPALAPRTSTTVGRGGYGNNVRSVRSRQYEQNGGKSDKEGGNSLCEKITSILN